MPAWLKFRAVGKSAMVVRLVAAAVFALLVVMDCTGVLQILELVNSSPATRF
jgi:hypothetical protein